MRILIAEDEFVSRRILEATLVKWGYDVIVTCDGNEAWQVLQFKDAPKLVILDWMMPIMDGLAVCIKMRESPNCQSTYIILLTVKGQKEDIIRGLQAGADDYVTKPFDPEELHARIQVGLRMLELHRIKNELISIVSHELRNPLTSILSALSLVADGQTGELPDQAKNMVDIAYRNSKRLLKLINDLLDIGKIESGKMEFHFRPQDLTALVEQTIEANRPYAEQLEVALELDNRSPVARVNVDGDRLMQVLTNLLSNAIRFSPQFGKVTISISQFDGAVRVAVSDSGPGIPEEFRDRIFQKFSQSHYPGARKRGGTGLGLSIAKAIVEAMKGKIGFETEINSGTTFYFDLPEYQEIVNSL